METNIVDRAIEAAGSVKALADALDIKVQAIYEWRKYGKIPPLRVLDIERITGIPRHELRPDFYPKDDTRVA